MTLSIQETLELISKRDSLQQLETCSEQDNHQQQRSRKMLIWCRTIYKGFHTLILHRILHHFSIISLMISTACKQTPFKEPLNNNNWADSSRETHSSRINHSAVPSIQEWQSKKRSSRCLNKFKSFQKCNLRISQWRSKQVPNKVR